MPFFSIVIPVYNRAHLIETTLKCVFNQSFTDFEVILVDDGSTDDLCNVVQKFKFNTNFTYHYQKNAERGTARNSGYKLSKGVYVVFFDSDDMMHADHLQVLFDSINSLPTAPDLIATKYQFKKGHILTSHPIMSNFKQQYYDYKIVLDGNPFACNFAIKNNLRNITLFLEDRRFSIMEDWLFLIQNLILHRIYLIDKITITMLDHDDRSMRVESNILIEKRLIAQNWIEENIPLSNKELFYSRVMSYYLCAIHAYEHNKRLDSLRFISKVITTRYVSLDSIFLVVKVLLGYNFIKKIKNAIR